MAGPDLAALDRMAAAALAHVRDGALLGLGTGRAAEAFIRLLGHRVRAGLSIKGVATSSRSETLAREVGVPLTTLDDVGGLDVAVDGADEVTPDLSLTKGLGGALLRERVVASSAKSFIVLVTPEKLVPRLGTRCPIPIEVVPFARMPVARRLRDLGGTPVLRVQKDGTPVMSDNGNVLIDTNFGPLEDAASQDAAIRRIPGVVDTGLFLAMADLVLVGDKDAVRELRRA